MGENPSKSQVHAWLDSRRVLRGAYQRVLLERPESLLWTLAFEYELPRERGRRPDLVILAGGDIIVVEFKEHSVATPAFRDQVEAYARDLSEYHAASHGRRVHSLLVLTGAQDDFDPSDIACSPQQLSERLLALPIGTSPPIVPSEWLESEYQPLPSLVCAARMIFDHEPLPNVRRAESYGVNEAVALLRNLAVECRSEGGMRLALVTGVPGAGKTLVGLKFVYDSDLDHDGHPGAVFLSGNGPLVNVLQYVLKSRVFVRDVHGFLKRYGGTSTKMPAEHIWVYDEAQRAWDSAMVKEKGRSEFSEPEDFLNIGEKHGDWALMIGLIGEGQEINRGEESGLRQWNQAIANSGREWKVYCPSRVASTFTAAAETVAADELNLDRSLRSHRADRVHEWVALVLEGDSDRAYDIATELKAEGFAMYATQDVEAARLYVKERYAESLEARYGLLVSSKGRLRDKGFPDDFYLKHGPWFDDPPTSRSSCCSLEVAATEFQCQGLELDMPIVGWGLDFVRTQGRWLLPPRARATTRDPLQITKNAYRVLLTRGRDGLVIVTPPMLGLDEVHKLLVDSGCNTLSRVWLPE